jgi:hypothetical protein
MPEVTGISANILQQFGARMEREPRIEDWNWIGGIFVAALIAIAFGIVPISQ